MAGDRLETIIEYEVEHCPRCNRSHAFKLKALIEPKTEDKVLLFGGGSQSIREAEVLFTCPDTNKRFSWQVPQPPDGEILGIAYGEEVAAGARDKSRASPSFPSDFDDWVSKSRDTAVNYCNLMLSASTGGIPVYFAVLKYIGYQSVGTGVFSKFAVLPPVLLLLAAILFVIALRPRFDAIRPDEFTAFRAHRLKELNRFMTIGSAIFTLAVGLAIAMMFVALGT